MLQCIKKGWNRLVSPKTTSINSVVEVLKEIYSAERLQHAVYASSPYPSPFYNPNQNTSPFYNPNQNTSPIIYSPTQQGTWANGLPRFAIIQDGYTYIDPATGVEYEWFAISGKWAAHYGGSPASEECKHEWKEYVGFTDVYNYCTKCDKKDK